MFVFLFNSSSNVCANTNTIKELKSSYLQSIHDDSRIFLEGIELFIRRDYPRFWQNIINNRPIPQEEINRYSKELEPFEGQLDSLYEEYISFLQSSEGGKSAINSSLELKIYQILLYSYMKTGDFGMSYTLMQKKNIFTQNFTVKLIDIEGNLKDFQLTKELKELCRLISSNLVQLNLRLKYFSISDTLSKYAWLKMSDYDIENLFNKTYFSYYQRGVIGVGEKSQNTIHFKEIIRFFNRKNYNSILKRNKLSERNRQYIQTYSFPIIKGKYYIDLKDDTILASMSSKNKTINLEHLCVFKGVVQTDFRRLKSEEKKNIKNTTITGKGFYLEKLNIFKDEDMENSDIDTRKRKLNANRHLKIGEMLRYGVYRLFQNSKYIGMIELVPCNKGRNCKKRSVDKSITKITVYNHELTFYQDILDKVQANQRMYAKHNYVTPVMKKSKPKFATHKKNRQSGVASAGDAKIHVGKGCASGK